MLLVFGSSLEFILPGDPSDAKLVIVDDEFCKWPGIRYISYVRIYVYVHWRVHGYSIESIYHQVSLGILLGVKNSLSGYYSSLKVFLVCRYTSI